MSPRARRVLQALLYEGIAISVVAPTISILFSYPPASAFALSVIMSSTALAWNYLFNVFFERWESKQPTKGRSLARRICHGIGFESGLTVILAPIVAYWLNITLFEALLTNLGLLVFFFVYTIGFTWSFDKIFGLPQSALPIGKT
jgi:uncharacterized membrane protein